MIKVSIVFLTFFLFSCNLAEFHQKQLTNKFERKGLEEGFFKSDHSNVHYFEGGSGETVLLIHGFGGDGQVTWEAAARELVKDYRVIIPDLLWFGQSNSSQPPNLQSQVEGLEGLLNHLEVDTLKVVGISYGGFVSLGLSLSEEVDVSQMVIVDSPGLTYDLDLLDSLCLQNEVEKVDDIFVPKNSEQVQRLFNIAVYKDRKIPSVILEDMYTLYFAQNHDQLTQLLTSLPEQKTQFEDVERGDFPKNVALIWGEYDVVFPVSEGKKLADYFGAEMKIIEKAGHAPNIEQSKAFNEVLVNLLQAAK